MELKIDDQLLLKNLRVAEEIEEPQLLTSKPRQDYVTLKPSPGICIKTKNTSDDAKVFINVCTSEKVPIPEDITDDELLEVLESEDPSNFKIPMSIGAGHDEKDKNGISCTAYDIIIHPEFLKKLQDDQLFQNFFMVATLEGLDAKFSLNLDKNRWVVLKNRKYIGSLTEQCVRTAIPLVQELSSVRKWGTQDVGSHVDEPKLIQEVSTTYRKKKNSPLYFAYTNGENTPKTFCLDVVLPDVIVESESFHVNLSDTRIVVDTTEHFLDVTLPVNIDSSKAQSCFVSDVMELSIRAPIVAS